MGFFFLSELKIASIHSVHLNTNSTQFILLNVCCIFKYFKMISTDPLNKCPSMVTALFLGYIQLCSGCLIKYVCILGCSGNNSTRVFTAVLVRILIDRMHSQASYPNPQSNLDPILTSILKVNLHLQTAL